MHSYAIDSRERKSTPFYLALIAIVVAHFTNLTAIVNSLLNIFGYKLSLNVSLPSGFVIYGFLYYQYDKRLWKFEPFKGLRISNIPNISGTYTGNLVSSHSDSKKSHDVKVVICQTWTLIRITLETDRSHSKSEMGYMSTTSQLEYELRWEYLAESTLAEDNGRFNHRGVTKLRFTYANNILSTMTGDYYTQHGRDTNGTLTLERVGSNE